MNDFSTSYDELKVAVLDACGRQGEWPARVAAGIHAALSFASTNPPAARALTIEARPSHADDGHYSRMIRHFCEMVAEVVPGNKPVKSSRDEALIGGIASVIGDHLRRDRCDELPAIAPDLVYLALVPYLGFAEAKRWAQSTSAS